MQRSVPSATVFVLIFGAFLVASAGCSGPAPRDTSRTSARIADLEMLDDTVSVAFGRTDRIRLEAAVETGCVGVDEDARSECDLEDETRWLIRDSTVAWLYVHTRSRYHARDTAWAIYLLEKAGRTWVVVTNQTGEVADSTMLTVEPEE